MFWKSFDWTHDRSCTMLKNRWNSTRTITCCSCDRRISWLGRIWELRRRHEHKVSMNIPIDVPSTMSMNIPASFNAQITPTCDIFLASPLPRISPTDFPKSRRANRWKSSLNNVSEKYKNVWRIRWKVYFWISVCNTCFNAVLERPTRGRTGFVLLRKAICMWWWSSLIRDRFRSHLRVRPEVMLCSTCNSIKFFLTVVFMFSRNFLYSSIFDKFSVRFIIKM